MARTNFSFQKRQKELAKKKKKEEKMQRKLEKKGRPSDGSEVIAGPDSEGEMTEPVAGASPAGDAERPQGTGGPGASPQ